MIFNLHGSLHKITIYKIQNYHTTTQEVEYQKEYEMYLRKEPSGGKAGNIFRKYQ